MHMRGPAKPRKKSKKSCLLTTGLARQYQDALRGTVWEIIFETACFWTQFADFYVICMLAKTSKMFYHGAASSDLALQAVTKNLPLMRKAKLSSIFKVPRKLLPLSGMKEISTNFILLQPEKVLPLCYKLHGNALGLYEKRCKSSPSSTEAYWPRAVIYQRILPVFLCFLLQEVQRAGATPALQHKLFVSHRQIHDFVEDYARKFWGKEQISSSLIFHFLTNLKFNHYDHCMRENRKQKTTISYEWVDRSLQWQMQPLKIIEFEYPLTHRRIFKSMGLTHAC
jgi:hypothetical protein